MTRERGPAITQYDMVELWSKSQLFKNIQRRKSTELNHQAFLLAFDPVPRDGAPCLVGSSGNMESRIGRPTGPAVYFLVDPNRWTARMYGPRFLRCQDVMSGCHQKFQTGTFD